MSDDAVYVISVAAELAGVHPQTLRVYERKGLVQPARTAGNTRRYSAADIARLRRIQDLTSDEGVNLAGVRLVLELEEEVNRLRDALEDVTERLHALEDDLADQLRARDARAILPARAHRDLNDLLSMLEKEARARRAIPLGPAMSR